MVITASLLGSLECKCLAIKNDRNLFTTLSHKLTNGVDHVFLPMMVNIVSSLSHLWLVSVSNGATWSDCN